MLQLLNYNCNPKGKRTGDCVIRAIAYASKQEWDTVFLELQKIALKEKACCDEKSVFEDYLYQLGFEKMKMPRKTDTTRYEVRELDDVVNTYQYDVVVSVAHHLTCLSEGNIIDTWNCGYKCAGNYWIRSVLSKDHRPENHFKARKRRIRL